MVFKAYRRGLTVSAPRLTTTHGVGESKLNRFGDAWRHVRFMLSLQPQPGHPLARQDSCSPSGSSACSCSRWARSTSSDTPGRSTRRPTIRSVDAYRRTGHSLGVFARTYARVAIPASADALLESLGSHLTVRARPHSIGSMLALAFCRWSVAVGVEWASHNFGIWGEHTRPRFASAASGWGSRSCSKCLPCAVEHAVATRCHRQHDAERMTVVEPTGYVRAQQAT